MISEPLLLTLLCTIAATAVIGAINAHGVVRLVISSVLALLCAGAAIFHAAQYLALKSPPSESAGVLESEKPAELPVELPVTTPVAMDTTPVPVAEKTTSSAPVPSPAIPELKGIAEEAQKLQGSLADINLMNATQMDEGEYIRLRDRASRYVAEAMNLRNRLLILVAAPPPGLEEPVESLKGATGNLVAATADLKRFFNAESRTEELACADRFRNSVQYAGSALKKIESRF